MSELRLLPRRLAAATRSMRALHSAMGLGTVAVAGLFLIVNMELFIGQYIAFLRMIINVTGESGLFFLQQ